jgi:hypothetical protein
MGKRELQRDGEEETSKARFGERHVETERDVEMGEFEDPWEDELDEEEDVIEAGEEDDEDEGRHKCSGKADLRNGGCGGRERGLFTLRDTGEGPRSDA